MRRTAAVLLATLLATAQMPAFGAEKTASAGKDMCILYSQGCPCQMQTLQEKIASLKGEIAKGTNVYTHDELQHLRYKLNEATAMFYTLIYNRNFDY
ncbi:MAG TPA: hypothetical protein VI389_10415 [Geobacteraceae bacterium]